MVRGEHTLKLGIMLNKRSRFSAHGHDYSIVDGDRCTPLVLDEDGVVWVSHANSSVLSITLSAIHDSILEAGFHIQQGNLNERLVARCVEAVAVGSGLVF